MDTLSSSRQPPIVVSHAAVKVWWGKYKVMAGAEGIQSAKQLEELHGDSIRPIALEHNSACKLCRVLSQRQPPIFVSDGVAKQWLRQFGPSGQLKYIDNAVHLESEYGERIRLHFGIETVDSAILLQWLFRVHSVSAPLRVCQKWSTTSYSTGNKLLSADAVHQTLGECLVLPQYNECYHSDEAATELSQTLTETASPAYVSAVILRQWYSLYHPDAGPLRYHSAQELEGVFGTEMRRVYIGMSYRTLCSTLSLRRRPVLINQRTATTWLEKYSLTASASSPVLKRPACNAVVLKRPAGAAAGPIAKRPATAVAVLPPQAAVAEHLEKLVGAEVLERTCGDRYRSSRYTTWQVLVAAIVV